MKYRITNLFTGVVFENDENNFSSLGEFFKYIFSDWCEGEPDDIQEDIDNIAEWLDDMERQNMPPVRFDITNDKYNYYETFEAGRA